MKRHKKDKGYLLQEILICLFLFSVLVFIISVFLKRIILTEREKKESQIKYENVYLIGDKIMADIKNREFENFTYEGGQDNIHIRQNTLFLRKDGKFYKFEYEKGNLYVSDGNNILNLGAKSIIGKYDSVEFKRVDNLLIMTFKYKKDSEIRILNLL